MSTEMQNRCEEPIVKALEELINDDCLDIVDGENVTAYRLAKVTYLISCKIRFYGEKPVDHVLHIGTEDYAIRVKNCHKGFVSVTNDDGDTGVSYTEYYPFFYDYEDGEDGMISGLFSLAQMINEAWYQCNN